MAAPEFASAEPIINLHRRVVERLSHEVWLAFEARGAEIGGLLLGAVDAPSRLVEIRDFDPLLCEDRADRRFLLSDAEHSSLEMRLARRRSADGGALKVVGCYRSQIGEGLSLIADDLSFARACLGEVSGVFLMIRPTSSGDLSAGFFFWPSGQIDSGYTFQEFPFDTRRLAAALVASTAASAPSAPETVEPKESHPAPADNAARLSPPALVSIAPPPKAEASVAEPLREELPRRAREVVFQDQEVEPEQHHVVEWVRRARPLLGRAHALLGRGWDAVRRADISGRRERALRLDRRPLLVVLAVILSLLAYRAYRNRPPAPDAAALALQVERRENDLRVSWNRDTPTVNHASTGVLVIRDGDSPQRELPLDLEQLHNGSVVYSPISTSVQFRLEVTGPDNTKTAETVFALAANRAQRTAVGNRQPPAVRAVERRPAVTPAPKRSLPVQLAQARRPAGTGERSRSPALPASAVPKPAPATRLAPAQPSVNNGKSSRNQAPSATAVKPEQAQSATAFVAARPVHETRPNLSASVRSTVTSAVEVQLRVQIDESGRVVKADPLALRGPATEMLVAATQDAARLWKFTPARRGNQPIASEVVLTFSYRP